MPRAGGDDDVGMMGRRHVRGGGTFLEGKQGIGWGLMINQDHTAVKRKGFVCGGWVWMEYDPTGGKDLI